MFFLAAYCRCRQSNLARLANLDKLFLWRGLCSWPSQALCRFKLFHWKPCSCMNLAFPMHSTVFTLCQLWRPSYGNAFKSCMRPCFFVSLMLVAYCCVFDRRLQGQALNLGTITFHFAALVSVLTLVPCSTLHQTRILYHFIRFYSAHFASLGISWLARKLETLTS